jgi:predicted Fe-Mo cluster-binding NifX family protein
MKVAISSHDGKQDTQFSARFGRCEYFLIVDSDSKTWEAKVNPAASASGGAGTQVIQFLSDLGVEATISGRYGPNAFTALQAAGIAGYEASKGTPEQLLDKLQAGELKQASGPTGRGRRH